MNKYTIYTDATLCRHDLRKQRGTSTSAGKNIQFILTQPYTDMIYEKQRWTSTSAAKNIQFILKQPKADMIYVSKGGLQLQQNKYTIYTDATLCRHDLC